MKPNLEERLAILRELFPKTTLEDLPHRAFFYGIISLEEMDDLLEYLANKIWQGLN